MFSKIFSSNISIDSCGKTNINGVEINVPEGARIEVRNGTVYVNGKKYDGKELDSKEPINIIINGNVGVCICNGSITANNVVGDIDCGGSCTCGDVTGDIDAGGSVHCGNVSGSVDAGGSIRINK